MDRTRRPRGEHGAAAVEFAFIMLPLLAIVFGIMQYGFYFWSMQGGADTARYAARLASVGSAASCGDFRTQVADSLGSISSDPTEVYVTRDYVGTGAVGSVGSTVTVTVEFRSYDLNLPYVPFIDDGKVTSRASARVDFAPAASYSGCVRAKP
ncbi:TadE/TadG family type IV pilus assembly protein [Nocardioides aurantiacus]|uniref:Flp pilus assembly protein TadG n=1 Tax=Nocardioides aurantiacus TaxID=86796 RepID=A0A3N2CY56_9ACTN|nr:TadE/TadG family type IV pilus assembly protein [Nocardioides aurantiacus]ROR92144.1 Flp pilus assembly protein TadG [Nocardioides aurantiacus]